MNFKRRLQRLPPAPKRATNTQPVTAPGASLEELREKMEAILNRPADQQAGKERVPVGSFEELGFSLHQTAHGRCWRRRQGLLPSHHVGRFPTTGIAGSDPRILSLLALDPTLSDVSFEHALFLDTETTGLGGGAGTLAFLLGLAYFDGGRLWVDQLLLEGPEQEPAMLETLRELVAQSQVLVSFNGKSFDWPLLEGRYVMNALPAVTALPHLDLLHVARRIHRERLERCTLKHLECEVLGFEREGDVEGAEVASRYTHYLRSGDVDGIVQVVDHNTWDVVSMAALVALYGEPLPALDARDLPGVARTYKRAKALPEALQAAEQAVVRGAGPAALVVRGELHKARGDRLAALADLEAANAELSDPKLRLQLAKLYEHTVGDLEGALGLLDEGVAEKPEAVDKRRARLLRKLAKQQTH